MKKQRIAGKTAKIRTRKNFVPHHGILDVNYRGRRRVGLFQNYAQFSKQTLPRFPNRFVRTGEIMITRGLSIDTAVAWGKVIRENPAFCFEQLSGAGKNIFNQFHHFSAISYLPLFSSFALFFYFCFFCLLLFMFDIFLGTRVRTVVQIAMTVDYVL